MLEGSSSASTTLILIVHGERRVVMITLTEPLKKKGVLLLQEIDLNVSVSELTLVHFRSLLEVSIAVS